jgi:hypothetical protein
MIFRPESLCVYVAFCRLISQFIIIQKASGPIFVYVIMHIINIKYIVACRVTTIKEYGGLNSTG